MQLQGVLTTLLLAICCVDNVAGRAALLPRQGSSTTAPASTTNSPTTQGNTQTSSAQSSATSTTNSNKSTDNGQRQTTAQTSPTTSITSSTSHAIPTGHHNTTAAANKQNDLPIKPTITPAMGIVGVVLMLTGVLFGIGGIRHQWIVVFFSAAYLTSLSVAVLIIYVMSPPVSDAIQGAYMVAALLTGLIFGAISLVFKEVTEGLGCLLGGFCLSMWFLVLKPGGLIGSTTGRAIMIAVFAAVGWSLSFSQYTRNYGLIGCTAFAGAMICILGIDCFSRAGLKEFWLYIWDLNKNVFPIGTTTYPITRGIRVEIAGTVVLFLFGVMSQIKIWKIVRESKAKHEAAREAEAERREQRDSAIGKKVEAHNGRSLAQWEAVYGDKSKAHVHTDSGVGTSLDGDGKNSASVTERGLGSIEMNDMGGMVGKRSSKGPNTVMVHTGGDEEPTEQVRDLDLNLDPEERLWWEDFQSRKSESKPATVRSVDESSLNEMLLPNRPPVPGGPAVVPLPFAPAEQRSIGEGKSEASATAPTAKEEKPVNERRGIALNKLALDKLEQSAPAKLQRIDDDRASSVAATANDLDARSTYRKSLAPTIQLDNDRLSPFSDNFREDVPRSPRSPRTPEENPMDDEDDEILVRSPPPQIIEPEGASAKRKSTKEGKRRSSARHRATGSVGSANNDDAASQSDGEGSVHSLKADHLPESISKVAMAYRTNEWAKHIADADQPEYEVGPENEEVDEAGVQVEVGRPVEAPRPLDPAAMAETATPPELKVSTNPSFRQSKSIPNLSRKSSGPTPVYAFSRTASQQSLQRASSSTSITQQKRDLRASSAPFSQQQTLLESPVEEEDRDATSPYQNFYTPQASTSNLLDERNTRLSRRTTTTNFNALSNAANAATPSLNLTSATPEPGALPATTTADTSTTPSTADPTEDTLTLAERKALLTQTTSPPPAPAPARRLTTTNPTLIYDSHQPRRTNTVDTQRQSAMLTQWRASLQQTSGASRHDTLAEEQARQMMMSQREREGYRRQKEGRKRESRERGRDVAMRSGGMNGAHQEAMRRMQAKVKE